MNEETFQLTEPEQKKSAPIDIATGTLDLRLADCTEDSAVCPECMKTHHAVYHDEEPCDECCDKILLDNVIGQARRCRA